MDIMIYDSTGPLQGSTGWYLMVLGQYGVILVRGIRVKVVMRLI